MSSKSNSARMWVWIAILALFVLHQDFWFWDRYEPLVFGFMPIGMAWHGLLSILTSIVCFFATKHCFPEEDTDGTSHTGGEESKS